MTPVFRSCGAGGEGPAEDPDAGHRHSGACRLLSRLYAVATLVLLAADLAAVSPAPGRFPVQAGNQTVLVPFASNIDLELGSATATLAIIPIHGTGYDALTYLANAQNAAQLVPGAAAETVIVAPHFLIDDQVTGTIDPTMVYWDVSPFWGSSRALVGPGASSASLSAFTVLDQIVDHLLNESLFPRLERIVFVGHSAGGQMVNRYAASSPRETQARATRDIHFRYVVLAPSSYVYLDNRRVVSGTTNQFAVPNAPGCTAYNNYGYGLDGLYSYHSANGVTAGIMRQQYSSRFVFYLVGLEDDDPNDPSLSVTCQSMLQGSQRLERAIIHFNHIQDLFGSAIRDLQTFNPVPGVGHWGYGLMTSPQGLKAIFDYDLSDEDLDGFSDWDEWIWGTDPGMATSVPAIHASADLVTKMLTVAWQGHVHRAYRVWMSSDLQTWQAASGWIESAGGQMTYDLEIGEDWTQFVKVQGRLR